MGCWVMGREFLHVFEEWADSYDETVTGSDKEYEEVFRHYEEILDEVALRSEGHVLEFGAGTGNLTAKLLEKGRSVTAIEPSEQMRGIAKQKHSHATFLDGDFMQFPIPERVDSIVSTYAFHHLTDEEKEVAVKVYGKLLSNGGKIIFADTMFENEEVYGQTIEKAVKDGHHRLAEDLRTEYYSTIPYFTAIFEENGFFITFKRCNAFVWMIEAIKL